MIDDYTYFYKSSFALSEVKQNSCDVFVSAFTKAERVQSVFYKFKAGIKYWLDLPEYNYAKTDFARLSKPGTEVVHIDPGSVATDQLIEFVKRIISDEKLKGMSRPRLCIDSTGFIRPTLLFLMRLLHQYGIKKYDMVYSEPKYYKHREKTRFSFEQTTIAPIYGFEGEHHVETKNDLLIIGAGYEDGLVLKVSDYKKNTTKKLICGFPPLQADMYQENILKINEVDESIGPYDRILVSACDPFETAKVIREIVQEHENRHGDFNLYIAPLSTKAQTLGFGLYYITERLNTATSIIFPFAEKYEQETSEGTGRIWKYSIEI